MADDDETVTMTYRELAARLGIRPASAKARALRNRWRTTPGNDRLARVSVPVSALERPETAAEPRAEPPSPATPMLTELLRQIVEAQAKHSAEMERVQRDHAADLDRLRSEHGAATAQLRQDHGAVLARQAEMHQAEIARLQQAHEAETGRLMMIVEKLNRPWWRRWWKG